MTEQIPSPQPDEMRAAFIEEHGTEPENMTPGVWNAWQKAWQAAISGTQPKGTAPQEPSQKEVLRLATERVHQQFTDLLSYYTDPESGHVEHEAEEDEELTRLGRLLHSLEAMKESAAPAPAPAPDDCEPSDKARIAHLEALVADREKSLRKLRERAACSRCATPADCSVLGCAGRAAQAPAVGAETVAWRWRPVGGNWCMPTNKRELAEKLAADAGYEVQELAPKAAVPSPAVGAQQQEVSEFLYALLPKLGGMREAAESNATLEDRYSSLYDHIERQADRLAASKPPVHGTGGA